MSGLADIPFDMNDGSASTLGAWAGKVVLLVNVASRCGLTAQYAGLESLYRSRRDRGLVILGVPSNDFLAQEPGSDAEILDFCRVTYDVTFPLAAKMVVSGAGKHPLYAALTRARPHAQGEGPWRARLAGHGIAVNPLPEVQWNFEKFLIGRDGAVLARFAPDVAADDPLLTAAVDDALNR